MRFFLIFFLFLYLNVYSQYDQEHWFAPMYSGQAIGDGTTSLYLSTGDVNGVDVEIYSGPTLFKKVTISKNNPLIVPIPDALIITNQNEDVMTVSNKGLHIIATSRIFANLRIFSQVGSAMINSKGLAGVGQKFLSSHMPFSINHSSLYFQTSIIATEDNTEVSISGFDANVRFSDGTQRNSISIKLNKGQSYIISGSTLEAANLKGFIGAEINATKAISITNGAFNGQYFPNASQESLFSGQIMIDQAVPINRLGDKFVVMRGFGSILDGEKVLVMATEANTQVFLNDETTPFVTLNKGQHAVIPSSKYSFQRVGMYSMYISSTKKVYTYQISTSSDTGNPGGSYPKGSYMLVPPLNCYLPKTIDQVGYSISGSQNTKLNILTLKGSKVRVNGVELDSSYGPELVKGTQEWINYGYFAENDHLTIESDNTVTLGLFSNRQFGGYFAGFSSMPAISKLGSCETNVQLVVDDSYEEYRWYKDGVLLANETKNTLDPEKYGSGSYVAEVRNGTCPYLKTEAYVYSRCLDGIIIEEEIGDCNSFLWTIKFPDSNEAVDFSQTKLILNPLKGNVTLAGNTIEYFPDPNQPLSYNDDFSIRIYGYGPDPKTQVISFKIKVEKLDYQDQKITLCTANSSSPIFNLSDISFGQDQGNVIYFYESYGDAVDNISKIANPYSYEKSGDVYARIISKFSCFTIVKVELEALQSLPTVEKEFSLCLNGEKELEIKLSDYTNASDFIFYASQNDAAQEINAISNIQRVNQNVIFYGKRKNANGCLEAIMLDFTVGQIPKFDVSVQKDMATVNIISGDGPFLFALNDGDFTPNNVFTNLTSGFYKIHVKSENGCPSVSKEIFINTLSNVITPNGDGLNDTVDFSEFGSKNDYSIKILNRFGHAVFESVNDKNKLLWDGKTNGKSLPTGNYWYIITWNDGEGLQSLKGWIMLKNRQ